MASLDTSGDNGIPTSTILGVNITFEVSELTPLRLGMDLINATSLSQFCPFSQDYMFAYG